MNQNTNSNNPGTVDVFDLSEFEAELIEGKYDHILAKMKAPKRKAANKSKKKPTVISLNKPTIAKADVAKPIKLVEQFTTFTCLCCGGKSRILSQTLIQYQVSRTNNFVYRPITVANQADLKLIPTSRDAIQEVFQTIERCADCCNYYYPIEDEEPENEAVEDLDMTTALEPEEAPLEVALMERHPEFPNLEVRLALDKVCKETGYPCRGCAFRAKKASNEFFCDDILCQGSERMDGHNIIFFNTDKETKEPEEN